MCGMYVFARYPSYHIRQDFALKKITCAVTVALWLHLQLVNFESDTYTWGFSKIITLDRQSDPMPIVPILLLDLLGSEWYWGEASSNLCNLHGWLGELLRFHPDIQGHSCLNCTRMYLRIFGDVVRFHKGVLAEVRFNKNTGTGMFLPTLDHLNRRILIPSMEVPDSGFAWICYTTLYGYTCI